MATIKRTSIRVDIEIEKGSTFRHTFTWKVGPDSSNLTPVDLTGCTAKLNIKPNLSSSAILHSMTTENDGITLGGETGQITLYVSDSDSSNFNWSRGVYNLEVYFVNGDKRRLLRGQFNAYDEAVS